MLPNNQIRSCGRENKLETADASVRLSNLLKGVNVMGTELPLIHITDAYSFTSILAPGKLEPRPCKIFGEDLVYFFYGRPSYRTKHKGSNYVNANLPVVMIFHPSLICSNIKRVFPFDTGAFCIGLYSDFFHPNSKLEHFEVDPSVEGAQRVVAYFYRDNSEYYYGGSRKNVEIPSLNFEAEGIFEMARTSAGGKPDGTFNPDLRSSSVEIQIDKTVDVTNSLLGLIVPQIFFDDAGAKKSISDISPKYLESYSGVHNIGSESLTGIIFEKVSKIYKEEGLI